MMNKFDALIITGKLEVRFHGKEDLLNEVSNLQKSITDNDFVNFSISFGKLNELLKNAGIDDVNGEIQNLYNYVFESLSQDYKTLDREAKLNLHISELHFTTRTFNALKRSGLTTVQDIITANENGRIWIGRGLGKQNKSGIEIIGKLGELGFEIV